MSNRCQFIKDDFATPLRRRLNSLNGCALRHFLANSLRQDGKAGVVAQLVERLVRNEEVRGSTPLGSTSLVIKHLQKIRGW